jgi:hypothetical protein
MILPRKLSGHHKGQHKKLHGHHHHLVASVIPLVAEDMHLYRPKIIRPVISVDVLHHCGSLMIPDAHRKDMVSFPRSGSAPNLLWNLPMMLRLMNSPAA